MTDHLSSPTLHFAYDRASDRWSLHSRRRETPYLEGLRFGARWRAGGRSRRWHGNLRDVNAGPGPAIDSAHGRLQTFLIRGRATDHKRKSYLGLRWLVEFGLAEARPFLLWRVRVVNEGRGPIRLDEIELAVAGPRFDPRTFSLVDWLLSRDTGRVELPAGAIRLHESPGRQSFFSNGYQSWSYCGSLGADDRQPASLFALFNDAKILNRLTPRVSQPGHFTGEMFGVLSDLDHRAALVVGFLSQTEQFGHIEAHLDRLAPSLRLVAQADGVVLRPGEERATDWAYLQLADEGLDGLLEEYCAAAARANNARVPSRAPTGWCSWYHYFGTVTEEAIDGNLAAIEAGRDRLPLEFVQIDDGYQLQIGDWFETKPAFPSGMQSLAARIAAAGHTPGLWLAPYIVRPDARLVREHPDWLLRDRWGRPVSAGYNWGRWCLALDPTRPGVRDHIRRLIETAVQAWGFSYLKLDFLYAAGLPGRRFDSSLSRAQAMRQALSDIREAAGPETFLLGCGCPLGPAVGLVDAMRTGDDVAPNWHPQWLSPRLDRWLRREQTFVSTRNAIRNTLNRAALHRRWWLNDPDCLLVRDHATHLSEAEVATLASVVALSGGPLVLSDDMTRMNPQRLRYATALMPIVGAAGRPLNGLAPGTPEIVTLPLSGASGEWLVAGIFNWDDVARERTVPRQALGLTDESEYFISDFWGGEQNLIRPGEPLHLAPVAPHGVRLLAIRRRLAVPRLIGTSLHFSQGSEVAEWQVAAGEIRMRLVLGRHAAGRIVLHLPVPPVSAWAGEAPCAIERLSDELHAVEVRVPGEAEIVVRLSAGAGQP